MNEKIETKAIELTDEEAEKAAGGSGTLNVTCGKCHQSYTYTFPNATTYVASTTCPYCHHVNFYNPPSSGSGGTK